MLGGHLLGIYEKAMPSNLSWEEKLNTAAFLGFDFIEMSIDETDERILRLYWSKEQQDSLCKTINESGIAIKSICLSANRRYPLGSVHEEIRNKGLEIIKKAVLLANNLGIRVIQLAGYDVYYEESTQETRQSFLDGLKQACETAERFQVMLAMEIMDTPLMNSITKFLEYKKAIPSPWFTVYPDVGNLSAWGNNVREEIEKGIENIVAVHLKDTIAVKEDYPGQFKRVPFGAGCVDFIECFTTLEKLNYCGPYMVEMWNNPGADYLQEISEAKEFISKKFDEARKLLEAKI